MKLAATPGGTGMPRPSRSRGTSSATAAISWPAIRTKTTRRSATSPSSAGPGSNPASAARRQLRPGEGPGGAQEVEQRLRTAYLPLRAQPLQVGLGARDDGGVQQLLQPVLAQQLGQQGGIQRQCRGLSSRPAARPPRRRTRRRSRTAATGRTVMAPGSPPRQPAARGRRPVAVPRSARPGRTRRSGTPASSPARSGTRGTAPQRSAAGRSASAAATAASGTSGRAGAAATLGPRSPGTARRTGLSRPPRR